MANRFLQANNGDEPPVCPGCQKIVYPKDRPVAALKGQWHPQCLKCTTCSIVLSVRMLESYNNQPYCRAHRPTPTASQKGITDRADVQRAMNAPKAVKKEQGVDKTTRMTFAPGKISSAPVGATPHNFVPAVNSGPTNARKVQGVNKTERMTFAPGANTLNQGMQNMSVQDNSHQVGYDQSYSNDQSYNNEASYDQTSYDQGAEQSYDQGGYDQGAEQSYDQGGYDQQASYDQQGGYDQGAEQSYDQGAEQSYDQGGEQSYDQGGYDQNYSEQVGYDQNYSEEQQGEYEEGGNQGW